MICEEYILIVFAYLQNPLRKGYEHATGITSSIFMKCHYNLVDKRRNTISIIGNPSINSLNKLNKCPNANIKWERILMHFFLVQLLSPQGVRGVLFQNIDVMRHRTNE